MNISVVYINIHRTRFEIEIDHEKQTKQKVINSIVLQYFTTKIKIRKESMAHGTKQEPNHEMSRSWIPKKKIDTADSSKYLRQLGRNC